MKDNKPVKILRETDKVTRRLGHGAVKRNNQSVPSNTPHRIPTFRMNYMRMV